MPSDSSNKRHIFSVLVANEPGVTARVAGVLSGRGYNIESFVGAEIDRARHLSCITLVTTGTPMVIEQIKAQLGRLVPVHRVHDLAEEGPHVAVELALIKIVAPAANHPEARGVVERHGGRFIDSDAASAVFEITNSTDKVDQLLGLMTPYGRVVVVRTGTVAISLGPDDI